MHQRRYRVPLLCDGSAEFAAADAGGELARVVLSLAGSFAQAPQLHAELPM